MNEEKTIDYCIKIKTVDSMNNKTPFEFMTALSTDGERDYAVPFNDSFGAGVLTYLSSLSQGKSEYNSLVDGTHKVLDYIVTK